MNKASAIIEAVGLEQRYSDAEREVHVLRGVDLQVFAGEVLAIMGVSGSGKSTLLHLLGGLDQAAAGQVLWDGENIQRWSLSEQSDRRNKSLGFVYQFHHLLAEFRAWENVAMPLWIRREPQVASRARAESVLAQVGLADRADHKPSQLSGGERQRVALARALVGQPQCVLADEPTGNLDRESATQVFELMVRLARESGTAFVIVTHDAALAAKCDRTLRLEQGQLVGS
ncbi:MAG: lipoprotein-releasing transporter ATP-binding protein LolD [Pseudomonadota bacterium]